MNEFGDPPAVAEKAEDDYITKELEVCSNDIKVLTAGAYSHTQRGLYTRAIELKDGSRIILDYTDPETSTHIYSVFQEMALDEGGKNTVQYKWDSVNPALKTHQIIKEVNTSASLDNTHQRWPFQATDIQKIKALIDQVKTHRSEDGEAWPGSNPPAADTTG